MLKSLALIFICGLSLGSLFRKLKLPSLIGMLLMGIVLGPYALNLLDDTILSISADLRQLAPTQSLEHLVETRLAVSGAARRSTTPADITASKPEKGSVAPVCSSSATSRKAVLSKQDDFCGIPHVNSLKQRSQKEAHGCADCYAQQDGQWNRSESRNGDALASREAEEGSEHNNVGLAQRRYYSRGCCHRHLSNGTPRCLRH